MKKPEFPENLNTRGEDYLIQIMTSEDPNLLRSVALEMVVVIGHIYKRLQLHVALHPAFFLAGFLACYFFVK